ncbi:DUF397 domain-containing protein [Actinosynnema sp. NPDC050436]|uniref:DUF397 domain-containing protein n=1 Tax=Actinosynnema sp. NPDC050436 TaxID=3155659 RepID=UPI0033C6F9E3
MGTPELIPGTWRKSSSSGGNSDCVEVAHTRSAVAVRDSKNPGTALTVPRSTWSAFLAVLRRRRPA